MKEFLCILASGVACAVIGAGLGWFVGWFAPEFLLVLSSRFVFQDSQRVLTVLGAINGLALGLATMAAGLLIAALRKRLDP